MLIVTRKDIKNLRLPLDTDRKVLDIHKRGLKRSEVRRKLNELEATYKQKTKVLMSRFEGKYCIYENAAYAYIPVEAKQQWLIYYEIYVRSSPEYKMWIFLYNYIESRI